MKIVIFGLSISSSWGNGHATLWRGLCRALGERGHTVVFYEQDVPYYSSTRDMTDIPGCDLRLYETWEEIRGPAAQDLEDADAGIVTSYCPNGRSASRLVIDSGARIRCFYDLDTPVTLSRLDSGETVDYLPPEGLADFDLVLSYTGGEALGALQERLGARHVAPLYGSVDPEVHRPTQPDPTFTADLSYLGTYAQDRQDALARLFIEPARLRPDSRFVLGGAQYPASFPWTENIFFVRHLPPALHAAFYCSGRMTLNITRAAMAAMGYCPAGRLFEAAACGAPIVSDSWVGLDEFYKPGSEILLCSTTEDVLEALSLSDAELQRIARAARDRTLEEHTAAHRAMQLERILEGSASATQA